MTSSHSHQASATPEGGIGLAEVNAGLTDVNTGFPGVKTGSAEPDEQRGPDIVLVGAPGSGKSTVGALLAVRLGLPFRDVDAVIESRVGKPVAEIFADDGEAVFRAFEESTTAELLVHPGVLSLGGGAVLSPVTRSALRGRRVIWLQVSAATAARRVGLNEARPLLLGNVRGRLIKLLADRAVLYAEVAAETVDTDTRDPAGVVELIVAGRETGHG